MGLFQWILKRHRTGRILSSFKAVKERPAECVQLFGVKAFLDQLLSSEDYIARSSYEKSLQAYGECLENISGSIQRLSEELNSFTE